MQDTAPEGHWIHILICALRLPAVPVLKSFAFVPSPLSFAEIVTRPVLAAMLHAGLGDPDVAEAAVETTTPN